MPDTKRKDGTFRILPPGLGQPADLAAWGRVWNFTLNKSEVTPEQIPVLQACADFLKKNPSFYCRIVGLASRSGANAVNHRISDHRARNVHGWLVVHGGVTFDQLTHKSGSLFLALGEEAWRILGSPDVKAGDRKNEKDRHRTVVLMVWKHNNPTMALEMSVLRRLLLNDAHL